MPLVYQANIQPKGNLGIWKIEEDEKFFLTRLELDLEEQQQLSAIQGKRRLHWLAARMLIHYFSERRVRGSVLKDDFGKPYLTESAWQISISHTSDYAAVIAAPFRVGVDVQVLDERMAKVAHKFVHPQEMEAIYGSADLVLKLHVLWGLKESMFKVYSKGALSWKDNFRVEPFDYQCDRPGNVLCSVFDGEILHNFAGHYFLFNDEAMLTYVQENV